VSKGGWEKKGGHLGKVALRRDQKKGRGPERNKKRSSTLLNKRKRTKIWEPVVPEADPGSAVSKKKKRNHLEKRGELFKLRKKHGPGRDHR